VSRFKDILDRLAPAGAELKPLGEIAELVRGNGMPKTDLTNEGVGAIHYGEIYTRYGTWTKKTVSFVSPDIATRLAKVEPGNIVITNTSENIEDVGKAVAWLGERTIVTGGHATVIRHSEDPKYLSYWFQSESFFRQKKALATGTKVIDVSARQLSKILVPVPPVEVQREISRTLDALSELNAELESELMEELRKRQVQYGHYRDALLAKEVRRARLGELAELKYGFTASAAQTGDYRLVRITDITPSGKLAVNGAKYIPDSVPARDYLLRLGDLLVARTGATYGKTLLVSSDEPAVYASFLIRVRFRGATILPAFYWHFAQSSLYWSQAKAMVSTGGQPQFNANVLKLVELPVPPIREQERVVALLDEFDASVDELKERLLSEQKCRRRQYEYYRDQLLAFESSRKSAAGAVG
jgi:type I restriction enzyme S subunit